MDTLQIFENFFEESLDTQEQLDIVEDFRFYYKGKISNQSILDFFGYLTACVLAEIKQNLFGMIFSNRFLVNNVFRRSESPGGILDVIIDNELTRVKTLFIYNKPRFQNRFAKAGYQPDDIFTFFERMSIYLTEDIQSNTAHPAGELRQLMETYFSRKFDRFSLYHKILYQSLISNLKSELNKSFDLAIRKTKTNVANHIGISKITLEDAEGN